MLNRVLALLAAEGWFDSSRPFEKTINLTQGACLWLLLTRDGVCDAYVKFSDCFDLQQEAQRCAAASECYPSLAPRFVGYARRDGIDVLVCRAVDYHALDPRQIRGPRASRSVFADLVGYFAAMRSARGPAGLGPASNAEFFDNLGQYFASHPLASLARRWLGHSTVQRATQLPPLPQHGDLALNNIGQTRLGAAVIFDWEDFGASCLPGLDLFTLELSMAGDAGRLLAGRARHADGAQHFVRCACDAMQLDVGDYESLAPVYALVFRYLKRNSGPGVRERMDRLLLDLDQQHSGLRQ